jgi:putative endonuclease
MRDRSNLARGRWGEARAHRHLERCGFEVIGRNWRSPEPAVRGELDIIACGGDLVIFCEVKARRRTGFGGAAAAVDERKRRQVRGLAASWMRLHGARFERIRFDVIAIDGVRLTHLEAAF